MKKSIARRIAAQQNGRKSGGPATAAGTTLLPGESAERFHALRDSFIDYFRPAHPAELFYADQVASNAWRLLRSQCLETSSIKLASQPTPGQSR